MTDRQTDRRMDRQTDGQTTDKVIPMCRYAVQATQKSIYHWTCGITYFNFSSGLLYFLSPDLDTTIDNLFEIPVSALRKPKSGSTTADIK